MSVKITYKVPAGWHAEACRFWALGQKQAAIQAAILAYNAATEKPPALSLQLAYYFFLIGDHKSGAMILESQAARTPENIEVLTNLSVFHSRLGRYPDALKQLEKVLQIEPDSFNALDGMTKCLQKIGREEDARQTGSRSLAVKDQAAATVPLDGWAPPSMAPADFTKGKEREISFSLWGDNPRYLRGALRNALLAPDLYPGWTCRFNVDDSVPKEFLRLIEKSGAQLVMHPKEQSLREKLTRRFHIANDPDVGFFMVRDADSVFSIREVRAVDEWLNSGSWFHVMRDWWTHTDLMLAGLWGGVACVLPDLGQLFASYTPKHAETPNIDQWFLRDRVWPYVRTSCLVHDRFFDSPGRQPFPGPDALPRHHVGQDEFTAHGEFQANRLAPWIEQLECLKAGRMTGKP